MFTKVINHLLSDVEVFYQLEPQNVQPTNKW